MIKALDEAKNKYGNRPIYTNYDYYLKKEVTLTYSEFHRDVKLMANGLLAMGMPERLTYTISGTNNAWYIISMYAGWSINCIDVGMYPTYTSEAVK